MEFSQEDIDATLLEIVKQYEEKHQSDFGYTYDMTPTTEILREDFIILTIEDYEEMQDYTGGHYGCDESDIGTVVWDSGEGVFYNYEFVMQILNERKNIDGDVIFYEVISNFLL